MHDSDLVVYWSHRGQVLQFGLGGTFPPFDFQHKWKTPHALVDLYVIQTWRHIEVRIESKSLTDLLVRMASFTYAGSRGEGMPYQVQIRRDVKSRVDSIRPAIHILSFTFCGYFASVYTKHATKYEALTIHFSYFIQISCL